MYKLLFITSNDFKINQANERLNKYGIEVEKRILDFIEPQEKEVEKVALEKAKQVASQIKEPFIVEDSGLYINALNGFPGALLKPVITDIGESSILKLMQDINDRSAFIKSSLVYMDPEHRITKTFTGYKRGSISNYFKGDNPRKQMIPHIFIPDNSYKTLAEMNDDEWKEFLDLSRESNHFNKLGKWYYDYYIKSGKFKEQ